MYSLYDVPRVEFALLFLELSEKMEETDQKFACSFPFVALFALRNFGKTEFCSNNCQNFNVCETEFEQQR